MKTLGLALIILFQIFSLSAKKIDIERYRAHSSVQWCWAISALYDLALAGNEQVLDLGSADGKISAYLAARVPEGSVVGLDPSSEAIEFSMAAYPNDVYKRLSFVNEDATLFSAPDTFDLITAFCTLNWIDQKELAFSKIAENLKSGGSALIVIPCDTQNTQILYESYAQCSGLEILMSKRERTEVVFSSPDELKQWLRAILINRSEDEFSAFFERHLKTVQELYPQACDGRVYAFPFKLTLLLKKKI